MIDAFIVEVITALSAVPLALGTAAALRARGAKAPSAAPPRRSIRSLIRELPRRHRREAKTIVALARDRDKRHGPSRLDAFTARETLRSYLPDTIEPYLTVPAALRRLSRNGGPSPDQELARQLATLRSALERLRDDDADVAAERMAQNRNFLNERFGAPASEATDGEHTLLEHISNAITDFMRRS